jgi:hypothetical protein
MVNSSEFYYYKATIDKIHKNILKRKLAQKFSSSKINLKCNQHNSNLVNIDDALMTPAGISGAQGS